MADLEKKDLQPPLTQLPRRRPGALRGEIGMVPEFDVLSPDVLLAMEGGVDERLEI